MKRMICIAAAAALIALSACKDETPVQQPTDIATEAVTEAAATPDEGIDLSGFIARFDTAPGMAEQPVCDVDGVAVTAKGIEYDPIAGPVILFTAVNGSDRDILIQTDSAVVNGFMTGVDCDIEAKAGKTVEGTMTVPYVSLALADISRIAKVSFSLKILDAESFEVIAECEPAELTAEGYEDYVSSYDESGRTAYDSDGIKIVLKDMITGGVTDGDALIVYMYNGSDAAVTVQAQGVTVNGYELTSAMSTVILPGKRAVDTVDFFAMDMEEYGIENIDTVELSFKILDNTTWEPVAETELIRVEL